VRKKWKEEQGQAVAKLFIVFVRQSIPRLLDLVDVSYLELRQQRQQNLDGRNNTVLASCRSSRHKHHS